MKKVIAFGASSSRKSINKQLATWAAQQIEGVELEVLDLNDYEMPIFSVDREREGGIPGAAQIFKQKIKEADAIVVSFAEHNGSYAAAYKNITDWTSRIEKSMWLNTPMLLLATSPGTRGGASVLATATNAYPHHGAKVVGSFSLPSFKENFNDRITDSVLMGQFQEQLNKLKEALAS